MRVLVTGGSGFIGSNVLDVLLERAHQVINFDIKPPTFARHKAQWRAGDIRNLSDLEACFGDFQPDAILHLAARAEISSEKWEDFDSIHLGTANVIEAVERYGRLQRLVNVSTQLTIGPGYNPKSVLDFRPYTIYGEAKAFAESLMLRWQGDTPWLTVRPATVWGPYHPSMAEAIWKYLGKRLYLHPSGVEPVLRTYGYVRNTAEQMVALMLADPKATNRQVFYLADDIMDSSIWVDAFSQGLTGKKARRVHVAVLKTLGFAGDMAAKVGRRVPIDSGRVERMTECYPVPLEPTFDLIGKPGVNFETAVEESLAWLRQGAPERDY